MKRLTTAQVLSGAFLAAIAALAGCAETPATSSWATDVYRGRFSSLNHSMTTAEVLDIMGARGIPRQTGAGTTYDLVTGYTLTLFFDADRNHPREVVLHTPFENFRTHWTELSPSEITLGAPTTNPAH